MEDVEGGETHDDREGAGDVGPGQEGRVAGGLEGEDDEDPLSDAGNVNPELGDEGLIVVDDGGTGTGAGVAVLGRGGGAEGGVGGGSAALVPALGGGAGAGGAGTTGVGPRAPLRCGVEVRHEGGEPWGGSRGAARGGRGRGEKRGLVMWSEVDTNDILKAMKHIIMI